MAHGHMSLEGVQDGLVEDLGHQAHVLVDRNTVAARRGNARRLLPAVLQGVQTVVREFGYVLAGGPHTEHAACVLGAFFAGEEVMSEFSIGSNHKSSVSRSGAVTTVVYVINLCSDIAAALEGNPVDDGDLDDIVGLEFTCRSTTEPINEGVWKDIATGKDHLQQSKDDFDEFWHS